MNGIMYDILVHLVEGSLLWLGLGLVYLVGMRDRTWLTANRVFLVLSPLLCFLFPFLSDLYLPEMWITQTSWTLPIVEVMPEEVPNLFRQATNRSESIMLVLVSLVGFFLCVRLVQWGKMLLKIQSWPREKRKGYTLVKTDGDLPVSAFFRWILWHEAEQWDELAKQQVLEHEAAHARMGHTWDLLVYHLVSVIWWFHPLYHLFQRELHLVHEMQADRAATSTGSRKAYLNLLVEEALATRCRVVRPFGNSFIRLRARAIAKPRQLNRLAYGAALLMVPFILAFRPTLPPQWVLPQVIEETPVPLNMMDIHTLIGYPTQAKELQLEGMVVVRVLVGREGKYERHKIVHTDSPLFSEAIEQHIEKLTFEPARTKGEPVSVWVNIPFRFMLPEAP